MPLSLVIVIIIVLAVIVCAMITAFIVVVVSLLRHTNYTNDQLITSNFEWSEKLKDTIDYYEKEIGGLLSEMYGDEEELKN